MEEVEEETEENQAAEEEEAVEATEAMAGVTRRVSGITLQLIFNRGGAACVNLHERHLSALFPRLLSGLEATDCLR